MHINCTSPDTDPQSFWVFYHCKNLFLEYVGVFKQLLQLLVEIATTFVIKFLDQPLLDDWDRQSIIFSHHQTREMKHLSIRFIIIKHLLNCTSPAICMVIGCVAFPFGWNSDDFRKICGPESNRFEMGLCGIRWAYPLAIIGCIDGIILATLAFILATRHVRLQPEPVYQGSMYKGKEYHSYNPLCSRHSN